MFDVDRSDLADPQPLARALERGAIRDLLVVRTGRIGDVLVITPILRRLGERYPAVRLHVLVSRYARDVLRHHPAVDRRLDFDDRGPRWTRRRRWRDLSRRVQDLAPTAALQLSPRPGETDSLERAGVPTILWPREARGGARVPRLHVVEQLYSALRPLRVDSRPGDLEMFVSAVERRTVDQLLERSGVDPGRPLVVLHPGCFPARRGKLLSSGARRMWPQDSFAQLARRLHGELRAQILFSGAGRREVRAIRKLQSSLRSPTVDASGLDIVELAALLERANLLVTLDTGPMHLGAALRTPLVALFGPSDPNVTGPWGEGACAVLCKGLECSPCSHAAQRVPCFDNRCMKQIGVSDVFEACARLLWAR